MVPLRSGRNPYIMPRLHFKTAFNHLAAQCVLYCRFHVCCSISLDQLVEGKFPVFLRLYKHRNELRRKAVAHNTSDVCASTVRGLEDVYRDLCRSLMLAERSTSATLRIEKAKLEISTNLANTNRDHYSFLRSRFRWGFYDVPTTCSINSRLNTSAVGDLH